MGEQETLSYPLRGVPLRDAILHKEAFIFPPAEIARIFFETFDKKVIEYFRTFIEKHANITKWMISADFSVGTDRPLGCFAFTILPFDALPNEIERDVAGHLPRDLKESKNIQDQGIAWLRDNRRFHIAITLEHQKKVFVGGDGDTRKQAQDFVKATVAQMADARCDATPKTRKRVNELHQLSLRRNFNVKLLSNIWILSLFFACVSVLISRETRVDVIHWFPDRDSMTNWCDGIWADFAFWDVRFLAETLEVDMRHLRIGIGKPEQDASNEKMWFDYLVRSADWFAGSIAERDRKTGLPKGKHPKYSEMWQKVIVDAENVVVLHMDIGSDGAQFRRIGVTAVPIVDEEK